MRDSYDFSDGVQGKYVTARFEDSYPEDEQPEVKYWECTKCHGEFVDPDDHPSAWSGRNIAQIQQKEYWLGPTEPICAFCAHKSGIPSIDEE